MSSTPNILVIIVTWNKKDYVVNLLASLDDLDYPCEALDILVVDNASEDDTVSAIQQRFPSVRVVQNAENLGGTGGFNTGLRWAFEQEEGRYDYLWLLDNDVVVHRGALRALVELLETTPDAAIAGSTMMQLDYPWRINEMGAYVDRGNAYLYLNRHMEEIIIWKGVPLQRLLSQEVDLSALLTHCLPYMDVDYVAAASLLIRAPIAKQAGLWMDFFIHYDDVEWCLRIGKMGHRVLVSAKSLIWHLSAAAKVPTWVLYYDNRNTLYLLNKYSGSPAVVSTMRWIAKKAIYYVLIGKQDIANLHLMAILDFKRGIQGKKNIRLAANPIPNKKLLDMLADPAVKNVLLPWTINLFATKIHPDLVKIIKQRKDLVIYYLVPSLPFAVPLPNVKICSLPATRWRWRRYGYLWRLRNKHRFDLVLQSDYHPLPILSWLGREILFINDENFRRLPCPRLIDVGKLVLDVIKAIFGRDS